MENGPAPLMRGRTARSEAASAMLAGTSRTAAHSMARAAAWLISKDLSLQLLSGRRDLLRLKGMPLIRDLEHDRLLAALRKAESLLDEHKYDEARDELLQVHARAGKHGLRSAYLAWKMSIAFDCLCEPEKAAEYIEQAITLDPLSLPYQASQQAIIERLRSTLADPDTDLKAPWIAKLYALLQHFGEAEPASHLAYAKHRALNGDLEQALSILQALTLLNPAFDGAFRELIAVATQLERHDIAREAADQLRLIDRKGALGTPVAQA
jgi:tetratricopeptide (TPR) repeat protein